MKSSRPIRVRVLKWWNDPDWIRQTPGGLGHWGACQFTHDEISDPDYVVLTNHMIEPVELRIDPQRVWAVLQEPPDPAFRWLWRCSRGFARVYAPGGRSEFPGHRPHHGMLQWWVGKSYDELVAATPPDKTRDLSWITSGRLDFAGHFDRMRFLRRIRDRVELDLYGRHFERIADKWEGLAPYRYSLAVENCSAPHYWTEKVADCFLAWTMPIYYGAPNLADYFPAESFVWLDIRDRRAPQRLAEIVASDLAERHRDAIAEARRRVLDEHQFFPRMALEIEQHTREAPGPSPVRLQLEAARDETQQHLRRPWRRAWRFARHTLAFRGLRRLPRA